MTKKPQMIFAQQIDFWFYLEQLDQEKSLKGQKGLIGSQQYLCSCSVSLMHTILSNILPFITNEMLWEGENKGCVHNGNEPLYMTADNIYLFNMTAN
jgi:hypothetical protein